MLLLFCGGLLTPGLAFAYLDPATGSIILQMVMGGVAGAALLFKLGWRRFLGLFGGTSRPTGQEEDGPSGG